MTRTATSAPATVRDDHPETGDVLEEIIEGLSAPQKHLPSKYFYDAEGSLLFDAICELPEYYPTRTELAIMREHVANMARLIGPDALIVEPGSGSSTKTRLLLEALDQLVAYVPVEISRDHLDLSVQALHQAYPNLEILPVCADFTVFDTLPEPSRPAQRAVAYFPGSTLGNFEPQPAVSLLRRIASTVGPGGGLLLGADIRKQHPVMEAAYNDAQGVTAAFNLNLLTRINREFGGDFNLGAFRHRAFYNDTQGRMEMHLVSVEQQTVTVGDQSFEFRAGETIHTENSYKHTLDGVAELAADAGMSLVKRWTDTDVMFGVSYFTVD